MAQFTPPQFAPPQPSSTSLGSEVPSISNTANIPGSVETRGEVSKSVAKSHVIKSTTKLVVNSREEFAEYLAQSNLDLVTSWVEFEKSRDFILSSYIVYPQFNNAIEPLSGFLERYPQLNEPVSLLNLKIKQSVGS